MSDILSGYPNSPLVGSASFMESKYTNIPELFKFNILHHLVALDLGQSPELAGSTLSSMWQEKRCPGTRLELRWKEAAVSLSLRRAFEPSGGHSFSSLGQVKVQQSLNPVNLTDIQIPCEKIWKHSPRAKKIWMHTGGHKIEKSAAGPSYGNPNGCKWHFLQLKLNWWYLREATL